jgi:DNA-binding NarL/FixJ family response regulator
MESNCQVLLAVSQYLFRVGLRETISKFSFVSEIFEADTGIDAIKILESYKIDHIILDIKPDPLNNLEFTSIVRQKFPIIKIIGFYKLFQTFYISNFYERGADAVLSRNIDEIELCNAIQHIATKDKFYPDIKIRPKRKSEFLSDENRLPDNPVLLQRLKEIIFLLCMDKNTKEIATILSVSPKTIDKDRLLLHEVLETHSVVGIIKYGFTIDILLDNELLQKFEKYL